jgi:hypothetical protein
MNGLALAATAAKDALKHAVDSAVCTADGTHVTLPSSICIRETDQDARSYCVSYPEPSAHRRTRTMRSAMQTARDSMYARKLQNEVIKESRTMGNTVRGISKPVFRARSAKLSAVG